MTFASKIFLKNLTKPQQEKEIITKFLHRLQKKNATFEDKLEQPDFRVRVDGKRIGVEITQYFGDEMPNGGSEMKKRFSDWQKTAKELLDRFPYFYGAVHFKNGVEWDQNYKKILSEDFLNELQSIVDSFQDENPINITSYTNLNKIINNIYLQRQPTAQEYLWWDASLQSGKFEPKPEALRNRIQDKEEKALEYETTFDEKWLVIYAEGLGLDDIYPEQPEIEGINSSYFTHIFLWNKKLEDTIYLIYPENKKIFYPINDTEWKLLDWE